jgi:hypothetical protein
MNKINYRQQQNVMITNKETAKRVVAALKKENRLAFAIYDHKNYRTGKTEHWLFYYNYKTV